MDKLLAKLEKIDQHLGSIDITLAKQSEQLSEHMRRSLANEEAVQVIKTELKEVQSFSSNLKFLGKFLAWTFGSSGFILFMLHQIKLF